MIWGAFRVQPADPLPTEPMSTARNPLLLFEPRPSSPWQFAVRELAPQWQRHIERLQDRSDDIRVSH